MSGSHTRSPGALDGIRVLDLTRLAPGPYGTMLLADLGADVIVIGGGRAGLPVSELGRGKRFITLDLKAAEGVDALHRLVKTADVLIEGFRPGVAARLGAGYEELAALNHRLVYCSLTGYGQEGPMAQMAGHDIDYLAIAGALGATGPQSGPPAFAMNLVADFGGGGLLAAFAIVAALFEREGSGMGQHLDVAMVDGVMSMMAMHYPTWGTPVMPSRGRGLLGGEAPFYRCYECCDGRFVAVGTMEAAFFAAMWRGLSLGEVPDHMDLSVWPMIEARLDDAFRRRSRDEWAEHFHGTDACVAPVLDPDEAWEHPQAVARHGQLERWQVPAIPRFSRSDARARPEDTSDRTDELLEAVGLSTPEIGRARGLPAQVSGLSWPPNLVGPSGKPA